jgi:ssDNA-binding Zn-finger/Zn-ribbon topoisomerase 1
MSTKTEKQGKPAQMFLPQNYPDKYHCCGGEEEVELKDGSVYHQPIYGVLIYGPLHIIGDGGKETAACWVARCAKCHKITAIAHKRDMPQEYRYKLEACLRQDYTRRWLFKHEVLRESLDKNLEPRGGERMGEYVRRMKVYYADAAK